MPSQPRKDDLGQDPCTMTVSALTRCYRSGALSPVEAVRAALDRIDRGNGPVNAFSLLLPDEALAQARASEERWRRGTPLGRLDGVPTSIKDLTRMRGHPTLMGSRIVDASGPWTEDAPATAALRDAGAVFLGKTTTCEFGWKGVTDSPLCGITRNPWDLARTPGGSSGGAAAAVALGMGHLALGGDGGGSIRIPASFTGVFGLKPGAGRVPYYPPSAIGTLSHVGPIARCVEDAALMLAVMARRDPRDWLAQPDTDPGSLLDGLQSGVAGLRVGFSPDLGCAAPDPDVAAAFKAAVSVFGMLGAEPRPVDIRLDARPLYETLASAGKTRRYLMLSDAQRRLADPGYVAMAERGLGVGLQAYLAAEEARTEMGMAVNALFRDIDVLLTPTMPLTAFAAGCDVPPGSGLSRWTDWNPYTPPFNLTGNPAASIPCGQDAAGLPVGLQIVGDRYADATVLRAAAAFESARPFPLPPFPPA
ncbi:MAG: amidase [Sneathiellaceae bacterium]